MKPLDIKGLELLIKMCELSALRQRQERDKITMSALKKRGSLLKTLSCGQITPYEYSRKRTIIAEKEREELTKHSIW